MLSYWPCRRLNVLCCSRTSCTYRQAESCWSVHGVHVPQKKTEIPQESNQSQHDRAETPNCAYRHDATESMHLWAGIASVSASVAASQAPCLHAQIIYQAQ